MHLLLKANHKDNTHRGQLVKRGQLITGRYKLSGETGLSERQVRTALDKLLATNEVTSKTTNKNSLITILNYDLYQNSESERPTERPAKSPTNDQPDVHKQEVKNEKKKEGKNKGELILYPSFDDFWDLYDKKSGSKNKCVKVWNKQSQSVKENIISHVEEYVRSTPDKQYRKNPETYLNQSHWENEILNLNNNNTDEKREQVSNIARQIINQYPNL
jgi:hypothetical protein